MVELVRPASHGRLIRLTAALAVLGAGEWLVVVVRSAQAPAWVHWLCSPSALHPFHPGPGLTGLLVRALNVLRLVLPHWPHILPIFVALWTLVYLWRANARHRAGEAQARVQS